jgi:hypothetical protein
MLDERPINTNRAITARMIKGKSLRLFMGFIVCGLICKGRDKGGKKLRAERDIRIYREKRR